MRPPYFLRFARLLTCAFTFSCAPNALHAGSAIYVSDTTISSAVDLSSSSNTGVFIANDSTFTITGTGSLIAEDITVGAYVSDYGGPTWNGNLLITGGGDLTTYSAFSASRIGYFKSGGVSAVGTATVTGAGSSWIASNQGIIIGYDGGIGYLTIADGGYVQTPYSVIGGTNGTGFGTGTVTVTGAGSHFYHIGALSIGSGGTSTLTLADSGKVTVGGGSGSLQLYNGTVNIGATSTGTAAAAGILNAVSVNAILDGVTLQFNTTGTAANPTYFTRDGTATGIGVNYTGSGSVASRLVNTAGYTVFTGAITAPGGIFVNGGTIQIGNGAGTGTLSGDIVNNAAVVFKRGSSLDYDGDISGTGTLTQAGSGTLTLVGANTYTGGTTISSGTLQIGNGGTTGSIIGNVIDNGTLAFNHSDDLSFSGVISGSGSLNKHGAGTLTLTTANTYTGDTTLNTGTLGLGADNAIGSGMLTINSGTLRASGSARTLSNNVVFNGNFTLGRATNLTGSIALTKNITLTSANPDTGSATTSTLSGVISGNYGITFVDGTNPIGAIVLSNSNIYTGDTTLLSGTLTLANSLALQNSTFDYKGGTLDLGALGNVTFGGLSGNQALALTNTSASAIALTLGGNHASTSYSGMLSGSGSLTKTGSGTLTLTGNHTYTGGTTISAGTLQLGDGGTTGSIVGNITNNGSVAFNRSDAVTYSNVISGSGSFIKSGSGTLTFTGANTYNGGTTINAGMLQIGNGGTTGSITGNIVNNAALVFNRSDDVTCSGTISGTGSLAQSGSGTLTLTSTNTYTGSTTLNAGTLGIGAGDALGTGTLTINGGTLRAVGSGRTLNNNVVLNGDFTLGRVTHLAGSITLADDITITSANPDTDAGAVFTSTLSGVISGNHGLTFTEGGNPIGKIILSGDNTYTGTTTISAGTLQIGNGGTTGSVAGEIINHAALIFNRSDSLTYAGGISGSGSFTQAGFGTLTLTGNHTYTGGTTISSGTLRIGNGGTSGGITGNISNNAALVFNRSDALAYADVISGSGSLTQTGSGTLTLTGANTYSGGTTINAGTISIANASALGSGSLALNNGTLANTAALTFSPSITLGSGGTFSTAGGELILTGEISGSGSLTKSGGSTLTLTSANTYTGGTTLNAGILALGSDNALGTGTLTLNGGTLRAAGAGRTLTNHVIFNGDFTLGRSTNLSGAITLTKNITLTSANPDAQGATSTSTLSGVISGNYGLTFTEGTNPTGTLVLSGANTYTGNTVLQSGKLTLAHSLALQNSTFDYQGGTLGFESITTATFGGLAGSQALALTNASSSAVDLTVGGNNASTTYSGMLTGSGSFIKTGSGTLTLTGNNTHTGGTLISSGTLQIGVGGSTGSLSGDISNNAALIFNRSGALTYSGVISGSGSLTKTGSGTLTLTGENTYTGTTTISGGALALSGGDNRLATTGTLYLTGGGTLDLGGNTQTLAGLGSASSRLTGNITSGTIATTGYTYLQSGTYANTFTGASSTARLWIGGDSSATVTLNGTNDSIYTADHNQVIIGYTSITGAAGTVKLGNANALAAATENVQVWSGTLDLNGQANVRANSITLASGSLSKLVNNSTSSSASYTGTVTLSGNDSKLGGNGDLTLSGALNGTSFNKTGAGTLTLSDDSFFSGSGVSRTVTLSEGTLSIAGNATTFDFNDAETGANTAFTFNYGTLKFATAGDTTITGGIYSDTSGYVDSYSGGMRFETTGQNVTLINAAILGNALAKTGSGTLTLSDTGDGFYSYGYTYLNEGTLALTKAGQLGASGLTIGDEWRFTPEGTLNLGGTTQSLSSNAETNVYAGSIVNGTLSTNGQLYLWGAGTLDATFTGSGDSARLWINADSGDTVYLGGSNERLYTSDHNQVIIGYSGAPVVKLLTSTALAAASENAQVFTGTLDLNGQTNVRANSIQLMSGASSKLVNTDTSHAASYAGSVTFSGSNSLGGSGALTLSGTLSGTGGFTKTGSGTLTLSGNSTYTGATTVSDGKLIVNGSLANTTITVASGATLGGSGTLSGLTTIANGGTLTPGNSPGLLLVNNDLVLANGSTTVMELGGLERGTSYDALDVSDLLNFGGTLEIIFYDGFTTANLQAGDSFDLFDWGDADGAFTTLNLADISAYGLEWDTSSLYTDGVLAVTVPEPGTWSFVTLAALGLLGIRRRKV